jgi:hypothetical protein
MVTEEFIIEKLKKKCPSGYELKSVIYPENKKTVFLEYSKLHNNITYNIDVSTINHHPYGNCYHNNLLTIRFNLIEDLLNKNTDNYTTNSSQLFWNKIFPNTFDNNLRLDKPIIFKAESDIDKAIDYVKNYIKEFVNDYFTYWTDIRLFLPFLETKNVRFLNDLLVGKGIERKLIIWKLCNHPNYESFLADRLVKYKEYIEENPKEKATIKKFKHIQQIVKRLEKVKPIYDWNPSYLTPKPFKGVLPIIP